MTNHSASQSKQPDGLQIAITAVGLTAQAVKLLEARGLDVELLSRLGWRSSSKNIAGSKIEIPYFVNGEEVNCKTRTLRGDKRFSQMKDGVKCFYNADAIAEWQLSGGALLITEGEMDCVAAMQCGLRAVSVPDGAPSHKLNEPLSKYSYLDGFPPDGEVIICADNDNAGANLLHDLGIRLGKHRCKWLTYPKGCKDLNDVLIAQGEAGVKQTIAGAQWLAVSGVVRMSELPPLPKPEIRPCGMIPINIRKGDFSVWTGIPSHGKSTFMNHIAHNMAESDWNVCFASFEQAPQTQHRFSLRTLVLGRKPTSVPIDELAHADRWIDERIGFIVPQNDEDTTLGWLLERMAASYMRHGIDMFIIDPWNEMDHAFDRREMTLTDYTGFAVKQLKKFAAKYNVHVAVVAHPAKMKRHPKTMKYPIPSLYDIADSAHWANKPDLGVIIHRDGEKTLIRVQKSRYHEDIGQPDDYYRNYNVETQRYGEGPTYSMA